MAKEGLPGLYKGLLPNLLKAAPASGTTFAVFEGLIAVYEARHSFIRNNEGGEQGTAIIHTNDGGRRSATAATRRGEKVAAGEEEARGRQKHQW